MIRNQMYVAVLILLENFKQLCCQALQGFFDHATHTIVSYD